MAAVSNSSSPSAFGAFVCCPRGKRGERSGCRRERLVWRPNREARIGVDTEGDAGEVERADVGQSMESMRVN
jgi:hypothetical protein